MRWYTEWRAKRELRKAAKLMKLVINKLPSSTFRNLIMNSDGSYMESCEAMTFIWQIADRIEKE
jgi:hypothetical protein